ncbi:probable protein phosphatase 2C 71 isoform X1 [Arabidopsis lyrata subsp. lyrata]|uniref:probable protein phosphatase 2C 71 isoform X1 n=1 Tax=Arabidopsis lyrata subsp. lyrata TaxID=81972 RepID=UPI000A29CE68|nr:probable protein phosphatase 2C 71 isoform X1 [Arabidopsis lyrata subsp. lyrata]|eukprot:XP_020878028.1 probable protein phosphatase 2C 71 isoform X1 [Arabidopsis lyrata subsp. lyrata]
MGYMDLALSYSNQMRIVEAPASGGGLSQNGKFSYGYASSAGKRSSMEDFFETRIDGIDGEIVGLFGVFDGHGGARAAEYVKRHLFSNLITHPKFISDTKSAIADAYTHTDSELLKSENSHTRDAGSTASTAILVGDRLLVANVGDSRAVICRGGNGILLRFLISHHDSWYYLLISSEMNLCALVAFAVSRDHKPDQSDERERIENAGGFVMWAGTWRVGGVLAVSRAFGDRLLKQYVVADPEIQVCNIPSLTYVLYLPHTCTYVLRSCLELQEEKIDDSLEFLILASDGLWDVFSNEEAVAVVKEVEDPEESTKKLVGEAIRRGSADNITCVVVRFLESKTANNNGSSSSEEANQVQTAVRNDSDHKNLTKETNQDHIAVHRDLDCSNADNENLNQKPIAVTAAGRSVSSEQSGLAEEKNQMPIAIRSGSDLKSSSTKVPNQGKITVHNDSDSSIANQKPVAATHTSSLEQSGSTSEKNRKSIQVHSDSPASRTSSSTPSIFN